MQPYWTSNTRGKGSRRKRFRAFRALTLERYKDTISSLGTNQHICSINLDFIMIAWQIRGVCVIWSEKGTNILPSESAFHRVHYGKLSLIAFAAIIATNMLVSPMITRRPSPANTMLAETLPMKNFPSRVPVGDQTWVPSPQPEYTFPAASS